jgi:phenylacetate-CoA ligase
MQVASRSAWKLLKARGRVEPCSLSEQSLTHDAHARTSRRHKVVDAGGRKARSVRLAMILRPPGGLHRLFLWRKATGMLYECGTLASCQGKHVETRKGGVVREGKVMSVPRTEALYRRSPIWLQNLLLNAHAMRVERHRYGVHCRNEVVKLRAQEVWSTRRMRDYQDEELRQLVAFAYARSSYYRRTFDEAGVRPNDIRGTADLPRLPLLTKELVRNRASEMVTTAVPRSGWLHGHTSGTTGTPLGVWYDRETCVATNAADRLHREWAGVRADDWCAMLLGRVVVPINQATSPYWRYNRIQRQLWFSSFHLSDATLPSYVAEMRRRGISVIEGYPSTLFILASYLVRRGERLPMRAVISSSETLHATQRETIEDAFDCSLSDYYALAERVLFAFQCECRGDKHLVESYGIAEVVDDEGNPVPDGTLGYLVGTSLRNRAMPLLRYRTSDVTAIEREPCECGRMARRIRSITTKAEDIVVTPDGRMISPSVLTHPFKPLEHISLSQVVQDRIDHILVKLVPTAGYTHEEEAQLVTALRERLGPSVTIDVQHVPTIPREKSGKFRWVISHVPHPCSLRWAGEEKSH